MKSVLYNRTFCNEECLVYRVEISVMKSFLIPFLQYHTEQDQKSLCFICSIPSHVLERQASVSMSHDFSHDAWVIILSRALPLPGFWPPCERRTQHVELHLLLCVPGDNWHQWPQCHREVCLSESECLTIQVHKCWDHPGRESGKWWLLLFLPFSLQIQSSSIDFFPLFKALSLEKTEDDTDTRQLEALQSTVRMVLEKVGRVRERQRDRELDRVGGRVVEEYMPRDICTILHFSFLPLSSGAAEVEREGT